VSGARNPAPEGGTSLQIMPWRDRDSGTDHLTPYPFTSAS